MKQIIILFYCLLSLQALTQSATALDFDGVNDYVQLPFIIDPAATNFTIEVWFKYDGFVPTTYRSIVGQEATPGMGRFYLATYNNRLLSACGYGNGTFISGTTTLVVGNWYHAAITYDGTDIKLYLNGILEASQTQNPEPAQGGLQIGKNRGLTSQIYRGTIDEVRIWDYSRCLTEIQGQKDCELAGNEAGLLAYYDFNQGISSGSNPAETILLDRQTNSAAKNGTLFGPFALTGATSNWVDGTANAVSSTTCATTLSPEINIVGNGTTISKGDITPATTDDTDFGTVLIPGNDVHTFTIDNSTGGEDLIVSTIVVSGTNAADFIVGGITLPATISAGSSTTFTLTFNPVASGLSASTITINNNDCNKAVYDFGVQGLGTGGVLSPATALDFDGVNDYVQLPFIIDPAATNFTIEVWFKYDGFVPTTYRSIVGQEATPGMGRFYLATYNNRLLSACGYGNGTFISGTTTLVVGNWYHAAITYDGTDIKLYLNGILEASQTQNPEPAQGGLQIGKNRGLTSQIYRGTIDEVRIWDYARNSSDIQGKKDCELNGNETGLLAYYDFNQGIAAANNTSETTLLDRQTNSAAKNGILTGPFALTGATSNWVVNSGSNFGLCIALPIELTVFDGQAQDNSNLLYWQTAMEIDNEYYVVQKSKDGINWIDAGKVDAQGDSNAAQDYSFEDTDPYTSTYYRLNYFDTEGVGEFSNVIVINNTQLENIASFSVFPNPANDIISFRLDTDSEIMDEVSITLVNGFGQKVLFRKADTDSQKMNLNVSSFTSGVYYLVIDTDQQSFTKKLIIQH